MPPARFETRADGYERWRTYVAAEGRERYVYVHQLLAIAEGAAPDQVFSDGEYQVHHRNRVRWDNRPGNVELQEADAHSEHHRPHREAGQARARRQLARGESR
ncbi:HNH endonuclease [Halobaculum sp. D14]|uniref:HNH endonuclease n=1 Tax=Halobaculum sp. D14 TaxID=3421642 RepID=UPI003EBB570A